MTHAFQSGDKSASHAGEQHSAIVYDLWGPDIRAIQAIEAVPRILKSACALTGMGFATIGRMTSEHWVCCASYDEVGFGMTPGTELDLGSTLCQIVFDTCQPVVIDEVACDPRFADHPTPKLFRFQSNLSVPIFLQDGSMFGTLCAIDEKPAIVSKPEIVETFRLFAALIGSQLDLGRLLAARSHSGDN